MSINGTSSLRGVGRPYAALGNREGDRLGLGDMRASAAQEPRGPGRRMRAVFRPIRDRGDRKIRCAVGRRWQATYTGLTMPPGNRGKAVRRPIPRVHIRRCVYSTSRARRNGRWQRRSQLKMLLLLGLRAYSRCKRCADRLLSPDWRRAQE